MGKFFGDNKSQFDVILVTTQDLREINELKKYKLDDKKLPGIMDTARSIKNKFEIELIRKVCAVSSESHNNLMKNSQPGLYEYQYEALFSQYTGFRGCRHLGYPTIVGSGPNSAILHYVDNNRIAGNNEFVLVDAGAEFLGYTADITRTFPANGVFTDDQKMIYNIVLSAQKRLISELKVGTVWNALTNNCFRYLMEGLKEHGFVIGTIEELLEKRIYRLFMPHGLGHYIGIDVHDTTIYPLIPLVEGMIVTIEPGVYFNKVLIDETLNDPEKKPYVNEDLLKKFYNFGGVRIEDDILITKNGYEVLTFAKKEVDEIEQYMSSK